MSFRSNVFSSLMLLGVTLGFANEAAAAYASYSSITAGDQFACVIQTTYQIPNTSPNSVLCWGTTVSLGNGMLYSSSKTPVAVLGLTSTVTQVSAGQDFACALLATGTIECWGDNTYDQLGFVNGKYLNRAQATANPNLAHITQISAGDTHVCAVDTSNLVWCWGNNQFGQLGADPSIYGEQSHLPVIVPLPGPALSVSAGTGFTCAIVHDIFVGGNYVMCWGYDEDGELGDGNSGHQTNTTPIFSFTPKFVRYGSDLSYSNPAMTAVSAGHDSACATDSAYHEWCWGANYYGELGNNQPYSLDSPNPATAQPVFVSSWFGTPMFTTMATGPQRESNCSVGTWSGTAFSNGVMECWGDNSGYQLGIGGPRNGSDPTNYYYPMWAQTFGVASPQTGYIYTPSEIAAGFQFACAIASAQNPNPLYINMVYCWGNNNGGQLAMPSSTSIVYVPSPG